MKNLIKIALATLALYSCTKPIPVEIPNIEDTTTNDTVAFKENIFD